MAEHMSVRERVIKKPLSFSLPMLLVGGVVVGVGVFVGSGDWACSAIGYSMLGGVVACAADAVIRRFTSVKWRGKQRLTLLAIIVLLAVLGARLEFTLEKPRLFAEAFHQPLSANVTDLHVERHYAGGPGDMICLMRFQASSQTIDQLAASGMLQRDVKSEEDYSADIRSWDSVWGTVGTLSGQYGPPWSNRPPMVKPQIYRRDDPMNQGNVNMIWDPATQTAYVQLSYG